MKSSDELIGIMDEIWRMWQAAHVGKSKRDLLDLVREHGLSEAFDKEDLVAWLLRP